MHNTYALGACSSRELAEDEFAALADVLGYIPDSKKVLAFRRLKKVNSSNERSEESNSSFQYCYEMCFFFKLQRSRSW